MTRKQIEKFAVGYPYPTDYIETILGKYDFDKKKTSEALQKMSYDEIAKEIQI